MKGRKFYYNDVSQCYTSRLWAVSSPSIYEYWFFCWYAPGENTGAAQPSGDSGYGNVRIGKFLQKLLITARKTAYVAYTAKILCWFCMQEQWGFYRGLRLDIRSWPGQVKILTRSFGRIMEIPDGVSLAKTLKHEAYNAWHFWHCDTAGLRQYQASAIAIHSFVK